MNVRKPISVQDKPITSFDEITPEFLAEKERQWEGVRLKELTLTKLKAVGEEFHEAKIGYQQAEVECKIRVLRAVNLGYDKKELAEAMNLPVQTINKWIRESIKK